MTTVLKPDVLIIGGGIAGLWLINHLQQRGYQCLLLEQNSLGGKQTLASQGIIHGGLKYALSGSLSGESESIANMPSRWKAALNGKGRVDLSGVPLLSQTQYLWSSGGMASRMTAFFASKMLRGRIDVLAPKQYPEALANPAFKGKVYKLEDIVVDTAALVHQLADNAAGRLLKVDGNRDRLVWGDQGLAFAEVQGVYIEPEMTIFSAGSGNGPLLDQAHKRGLLNDQHIQLRPLKMVMVKGQLPPFFGHCIGASNKPQLTVTSHATNDGDHVWYLGGDLAEAGVNRSDSEQIEAGRQLLTSLFPWLGFEQARFATLDVNRAEPKQQQMVKPDNAYVARDRGLMIAWPTKLTLAPDLADRVEQQLDAPRVAQLRLLDLEQAEVGRAQWHDCQWQAS